LVRAYTQSVSGALAQLTTAEKFIQLKWSVKVPYALFATLEHKLNNTNIHIGSKQFDQLIHVELLVPESENAWLESILADIGNGAIEFERID